MTDSSSACVIPPSASSRRRIVARGIVQGVGFRPLLYRRATDLGLGGWVANAAEGLVVEVEGPAAAVARFCAGLRGTPPPHARVEVVEDVELPLSGCGPGFRIAASTADAAAEACIPPDIAPCPECLAEMNDPADRRFRYAFTSCAHCGPRYSILAAPPYDRGNTSMAAFPMCPRCRAEYEDPADRRFHAQANACPDCGPTLAFLDGAGVPQASGEQALQAALALLRAGAVIGMKGLGGFLLLADAANPQAVAALRERKGRPDKPFALLVHDLAAARRLCEVSAAEASLLTSAERPIVLLARRPDAAVAPAVAPGTPSLGLMLPAAPLHVLVARGMHGPLVATSANAAGEPVLHGDDAPARLAGIADAFLVHDRAILRPVDDSVARIVAGRTMVLRRARGYTPASVPLPGGPDGILGAGGYLKNAVALSAGGRVQLGPHVCDLGAVASRRAQRSAAAGLIALVGGAAPTVVAHDLHPDMAPQPALVPWPARRVAVQHHVAHVAACIAERGLQGPVLGVAWDGTGYGTDGTAWGGEFLQVEGASWRRVARMRPFRLPGGDRAARAPWRAALGVLQELGEDPATAVLPGMDGLPRGDRDIVVQALRAGLNAPFTSSVGRLFDAIAALLGLAPLATTYEGQAAAAVEWAVRDAGGVGYWFPLSGAADAPAVVDFAPAVRALLADRDRGVPTSVIAARWHDGLADAVVAVARATGIPQVALAGGCFQNRVLVERVVTRLEHAGFRAAWPQLVPPNDGGLALGQVAWAARLEQAAP